MDGVSCFRIDIAIDGVQGFDLLVHISICISKSVLVACLIIEIDADLIDTL